MSQRQGDLLKTIRLPKKMLFLGGRLPKSQYEDPDKILEQEELDDDQMSEFYQGGKLNGSNGG
jgi:hypothetical protein